MEAKIREVDQEIVDFYISNSIYVYLTINGNILIESPKYSNITILGDNIVAIGYAPDCWVYGLDNNGILWIYNIIDNPITKKELMCNIMNFDIISFSTIDEDTTIIINNVAWLDYDGNLYLSSYHDMRNPIKIDIVGIVNFKLSYEEPWGINCVCDDGSVVRINSDRERVIIHKIHGIKVYDRDECLYLDINNNLRHVAPGDPILLQNVEYFKYNILITYDGIVYKLKHAHRRIVFVKLAKNSKLFQNYKPKTFAKSAMLRPAPAMGSVCERI
jgi:hypothetical protein